MLFAKAKLVLGNFTTERQLNTSSQLLFMFVELSMKQCPVRNLKVQSIPYKNVFIMVDNFKGLHDHIFI